MKKKLYLLPIILFPYGSVIFGAAAALISSSLPDTSKETVYAVQSVITLIFYISCPVCAVISAVSAARGKISPYESAKTNLIVKAVHIPAYVLNFVGASMGLFVGMIASVWGIGIAAVTIAFALIADICTIALTGISAVGCMINMYKGGAISKKFAVISGILSFIFCADIVTAIVLFVKCRKNRSYQPQELLL